MEERVGEKEHERVLLSNFNQIITVYSSLRTEYRDVIKVRDSSPAEPTLGATTGAPNSTRWLFVS